MLRSWLVVPVLAFALGCEKPPVAPPVSDGRADGPDRVALPAVPNDPDARQPGEVLLARAPQFRPLEPNGQHVLFLNIDARGQALFPVGFRPLMHDPEGDVKELDVVDAEQLKIIMNRRGREDRDAFRRVNGREPTPDEPLRTRIVLRVDRDTPFAKLAPILDAVRSAGFNKTEWRGLLADGREGAVRLGLYQGDVVGSGAAVTVLPDPARHYVVRVTADAKGQLARLTIRTEPLRDADLGINPDSEAAIPEIKRQDLENLDAKEVPDEPVLPPTAEPKRPLRPEPKKSPPEPKKNPEKVLGATPASLAAELSRLGFTKRPAPKASPREVASTPQLLDVLDSTPEFPEELVVEAGDKLTLEIDGRLRQAHLVPLLATLDAFGVPLVDLKLLGAKGR